MKRNPWLVLLLMAAPRAEAVMSPTFARIERMPCAGHVRSFLTDAFTRRYWRPLMVRIPNQPIAQGLASDDTRTGIGYELWAEGTKTIVVQNDESKAKKTVTIFDNEKQCRPATERATFTPASLPQPVAGFGDADLRKLLKTQKWGVIYVWTPYMPLSMKALKEIKTATTAKGGSLTILVDMKAEDADIERAIQLGNVAREDVRRVASPELLSRDISLHYPSAVYFEGGYLSNRYYRGHKTAAVYENWIDFENRQLKKELQ